MEISHDGDTYLVSFDVLITADAAKARALLGDYTQWPRLSDVVTGARLVSALPDGRQRVSLDVRSCVLKVFCKSIRQVKDMAVDPGATSYRTEMVPGLGDFASGWEHWRITAESDLRTRLRYDAKLIVAFNVPPLIGPWILKRELRRELIGTAERLEQLVARQRI